MEADHDSPPADQLFKAIEERHQLIQRSFPLRAAAPELPSAGAAAPPAPRRGAGEYQVVVPATDTTVIVPAEQSDLAKAVLQRAVERGVISALQMPKILARIYTPFVATALTWGDLRDPARPHHSLLSLFDLVSSGVSLMNLRAARLANSFEDLKRIFDFNPVDLKVNYSRFNLGHLNQFFQVNYTHLIVDFYVGIEGYLIDLNLELQDIASANITAQTGLDWPREVREAFLAFNRADPTARGAMDKRLAKLMRPLDAALFMRRVQLHGDSPENWHVYMGLGAPQLLQLGITRAQLMQLWGRDYGTLDTILAIFGCSKEDAARLGGGSAAAAPGERLLPALAPPGGSRRGGGAKDNHF